MEEESQPDNCYGLFNLSTGESISWFDFASEIKRRSKQFSKVKLVKINTEEYKTAAKRPLYSVLDNSKVRNTFEVQIDGWLDYLNTCFD